MDDVPLAAELAEIERRLAERRRPEAPGLRGRVLAAVGRELSRPERHFFHWRFAAAVAAALLVGINFSMSVVNDTDWHFKRRLHQRDLDLAVRQVKEMVPGIAEREAYRQALLLLAGSQVTKTPTARVSLDRVVEQRKGESWDTR